jgi:hypothetical protein
LGLQRTAVINGVITAGLHWGTMENGWHRTRSKYPFFCVSYSAMTALSCSWRAFCFAACFCLWRDAARAPAAPAAGIQDRDQVSRSNWLLVFS